MCKIIRGKTAQLVRENQRLQRELNEKTETLENAVVELAELYAEQDDALVELAELIVEEE